MAIQLVQSNFDFKKVARYSSDTSRGPIVPQNCSSVLLACIRVCPMLRWSAQLLLSSEIWGVSGIAASDFGAQTYQKWAKITKNHDIFAKTQKVCLLRCYFEFLGKIQKAFQSSGCATQWFTVALYVLYDNLTHLCRSRTGWTPPLFPRARDARWHGSAPVLPWETNTATE